MYAAYPETLAELNLEIGSQNCNCNNIDDLNLVVRYRIAVRSSSRMNKDIRPGKK